MTEKNKVYRAILTDVSAPEIREGFVALHCEYCLVNALGEIFRFVDEFDACVFDYKANVFFDFLKENNVPYENFDDLVGLVFEAELHEDARFRKVLIPIKLVAKPL